MSSKLYNFTPEELQSLIDTHSTYKSILELAGIKSASSTVTLKRIIEEYNLDTTKFEENKRNYILKCNQNRKEVYDIQSKLMPNTKVNSHKLKNKLIELEYKEKRCELCGNSEWMGKPIKLQLHHIDGNHDNNSLENLQILCPNCHSLTDNFGVYNSEKVKERIKERARNTCKKCGKKIRKNNKSNLCYLCYSKYHRKKKKKKKSPKKTITPLRNITREELKRLIRTVPFTQIGIMFGVSDNAIRKWCDKYNLPKKSTEIKEYSEDEWRNI